MRVDQASYWLTFLGVYFLVGVLLLTFACLSFGQTATGNNAGTASLFTYFGSTAVIFLLVARLSPRAPAG